MANLRKKGREDKKEENRRKLKRPKGDKSKESRKEREKKEREGGVGGNMHRATASCSCGRERPTAPAYKPRVCFVLSI